MDIKSAMTSIIGANRFVSTNNMISKIDSRPILHPGEAISKAVIAGVCCAFISSVLNPMDVTKIRMQNQSEAADKLYVTFFQSSTKIFKDEGFRGLCRGLTATNMRELSYSTVRIGSYDPIRVIFYDLTGTSTSPAVKFLSALCSGFIGSFFATPVDMIKTRFQAQLPGHPNYNQSTFSAIYNIYKTNGIRGLYRGWQVTTVRAAILTSAQLGSYDTIKNNLLIDHLRLENGFVLHLCASLSAGIITTTATNPVDVVKTRYMADTAQRYSSTFHCAQTVLRDDGLRGFFKGWTPSYWRLGPHTVMSFVLIEKTREFFGLKPI